MGLWILFLVSMVASLANCKKYPGSSSNRNWRESDVTKGASELSFHRGANGGISQKAFYTVNLSDNKKDNESRDCQEYETRHCNPITAGWNQFSPNEEKSLLVESREEETNRCNRSEFSLHCSQDDECRSPGVCQHISCHYPHVAEFRCPVLISPPASTRFTIWPQVCLYDKHPGGYTGWHYGQSPYPYCRPLCENQVRKDKLLQKMKKRDSLQVLEAISVAGKHNDSPHSSPQLLQPPLLHHWPTRICPYLL